MNTRQIVSVLLLSLGTIAAILPSKQSKYRKFSKEELQVEMQKSTYYVSPDELAELLIAGDPSVQLVDIRTDADSMLARAINIPADSLTAVKYEGFLYQKVKRTVLYSDDVEAMTAAWMNLKYEGYPNVYMLTGGLEAWRNTILDPTFPGVTASQSEIDLYSRRMAARSYFTGAKALPQTEFKVIIPAGGRKKKKVEGGCS